ncbi:MAG: hypothetical protein HN413_09640 [Chloroflexi bacterium]|jgi:ABC-type methionine transport system ATPase subunit|nr:hypothetical protein [Chloroflexota bacterium]
MDAQIIRLVYPSHLLDVPIINQLIRRFDLTVNILQAQVTSQDGWVEIQLTGKAHTIEAAITWLIESGIETQRIVNKTN